MAHEVETMAYYGEVPWHGLGVAVENAMTSEEALVKAGLNWGIRRDEVVVNGVIVPGYKAIVRDTDLRTLSIMKDTYKPHSNKECFDFFDTIVGEGQAIYHTAGALRGGKRVWMLAQLPGDIRVGETDDIIKKYLLLATSYDGTLATIGKLTPTRVVCNNTLNEAIAGEGGYIKFSHRSTLASKVAEAKRVLGFAQDAYKEFEATVSRFSTARFTEKHMKDLAAELFPANEEDEVSARAEASRAQLAYLYEAGKGQEMCRGTAWAAFNAVTEFTDHYRSTRVAKEASAAGDARLDSVWFGSGAGMKAKAFDIIDKVIADSVPGVTYTA